MISVTDALSFIEKNRPLTDVQVVSLEAALGRTLANNVEAKLTHPPLNASAMDGYAVKLADISERGARLTVIGEAPAGTPFSKEPAAKNEIRKSAELVCDAFSSG